MFGWRKRATIIGQGLKVVGKITAEGLVKIYGQVEGELNCTSLILARKAELKGAITAEKVVIDGKVEGPVDAADVVLGPSAHVIGDIRHQHLRIGKGAYFEGRSMHVQGPNGRAPAGKKLRRTAGNLVSTAEPAG
jgi:cytoskeletal protein CcmA (bactofilin family)